MGAQNSDTVGITANHHNMVKFSDPEEQGFKDVADRLEIMLRKATPKVKANWQERDSIKGS